MRNLVVLTALLIAAGCSSGPPIDEGAIRSTCRKFESLCDPTCMEKKFRSCWVDSEMFPTAPHEVFKHCYGMHTGNLCHPCEQNFTVNFGGAMRDLSCEEFMRSLGRKNKECGGCLKKFGDGPDF